MFRFAQWYLLFLIFPITYMFFRRKETRAIQFSSISLIRDAGLITKIKAKIGRYLIFLGVLSLLIALARPQSGKELMSIKKEGIDIVVSLDVSGSMKSVDFKPNRLEVAKGVIDQFISKRYNDRVSLAIFSGTAYTKIPLTLDHNILRETLAEVRIEDVNQGGTAIGMGMSVGINRLKKSDAKSKVIILVTDGENNSGRITPDTATQLAADLGIKIYTIGVGTDEIIIPTKVFGMTRYQKYVGGLDEELLKDIADKTNGRYFRAKEAETLTNIFEQIDSLEKSKFDMDNFFEYKELAFAFIKLGLILMLIGTFLEKYLFLKIP